MPKDLELAMVNQKQSNEKYSLLKNPQASLSSKVLTLIYSMLIELTFLQAFGYKVINSALDNFLVSGSEIFIDLSIKRGVRKLPQSFFLVEVGPPNN